MLYVTVLAIHRCATLAALLAFITTELLLMLARRGQSSPARIAVSAGSFGNIMVTIGVLAGVILLFVGGWPLTPWLLTSFALIAILMVVRRKFVGPWEARIQSALKSNASTTKIKACAGERAALVGRAIVIALFGLVAGLMATKPDFAKGFVHPAHHTVGRLFLCCRTI
jgi:hypothetical protein